MITKLNAYCSYVLEKWAYDMPRLRSDVSEHFHKKNQNPSTRAGAPPFFPVAVRAEIATIHP